MFMNRFICIILSLTMIECVLVLLEMGCLYAYVCLVVCPIAVSVGVEFVHGSALGLHMH